MKQIGKNYKIIGASKTGKNGNTDTYSGAGYRSLSSDIARVVRVVEDHCGGAYGYECEVMFVKGDGSLEKHIYTFLSEYLGEEAYDFKVGDKCIIKDCKFKNGTYSGVGYNRMMTDKITISRVTDYGILYANCKIRNVSDYGVTTRRLAFYEHELEKIEEEKEMEKINVGDFVTGTEESNDEYGVTNTEMTIGKVIDSSGTGSSSILVKVIKHEEPCYEGDTHWVDRVFFKKLTFAVGDKVRVTEQGSIVSRYNEGDVVTIVKDDGSSIPYACKKDEGPVQWFTVEGIVALDEEEAGEEEVKEEEIMTKFKKGDVVKPNGTTSEGYNITSVKGGMKSGEVLDSRIDYAGDEMILIKVDNSLSTFWVEAVKFVKLKSKPETKVFKFGDVKVVFNGDYTIVTDGKRTGKAKRHADDEYNALIGLEYAYERFEAGGEIKKGDRLEVIANVKSVYGRHSYEIGTTVIVKEVNADGSFWVGAEYGFLTQTLVKEEVRKIG